MPTLALVRITFKEQKKIFLALILLKLFLLYYSYFYLPGASVADKWRLFYSLTLETAFFLSFLSSLFALALPLPRDFKQKHIYLIFQKPIGPLAYLEGRILGAFFMAFLHTGIIYLVLSLLYLSSLAPFPARAHKFFPSQGLELKGGFRHHRKGIYWSTHPEASFDGQVPHINQDLVSSPALRIHILDLPAKTSKLEIIWEQLDSGTTKSLGVAVFHKKGDINIPLEKSPFLKSGKVRFHFRMGDFKKPLLMSNKAYLVFDSPKKKSSLSPIPLVLFHSKGCILKEGSLLFPKPHLQLHFHGIPSIQNEILLQWKPILLVSNSRSHAVLGIGASSDKIIFQKKIKIQDNQPALIRFSALKSQDLYVTIFWSDKKNPMAVDMTREPTGMPKNGMVLLFSPSPVLLEMAKVLLFYLIKILFFLHFLGFFALFLSSYVALFVGGAFYFICHQVENFRTFSKLLLEPPLPHEHHHGIQEVIHTHASLPKEPETWKVWLSHFSEWLSHIFPNFSRFDFLEPFLFGNYLSPSLLLDGILYSLPYVMVFLALSFLLLKTKEA